MSKKAFLVGINKYLGCPLQGCINDVHAMQAYLKARGFTVETCLDEQATYSNMVNGLKRLVNGTKEGDTVVFHYSGHGSQVPDRNADESDHLDEILCPIDIDFYKGLYVTDDELNSIFKRLPKNVNLEIVLDCCHSGTGLRDFDTRARFMPAPEDLTKDMVISSRELVIDSNKDRVDCVLWAACKSTETAADAQVGPNRFQGAMTFSLLAVLQQSGLSRKAIEQQLSQVMKSRHWNQTPQVECSEIQSKAHFLNDTFARGITQNDSQPSLWEKIKSWWS